MTKNTQNAIDFYRMAFLGNAKKAVELFVGDEYIQHNPLVEDGKKGFINYFAKMQTEYAQKSIEFVRHLEEGNLVALHTIQTWPDNDQYVTMDFFRFDSKGKIIEHWDAIQQVPEKMAHENGMI